MVIAPVPLTVLIVGVRAEILDSKKGPIYWSRRYAERIWGEFFILARRTVGKLPANFSANFDGEF